MTEMKRRGLAAEEWSSLEVSETEMSRFYARERKPVPSSFPPQL